MATATRIPNTVYTGVTLVLSNEEAQHLLRACGRIGGPYDLEGISTPRGSMNSIMVALEKAGYKREKRSDESPVEGNIYFS